MFVPAGRIHGETVVGKQVQVDVGGLVGAVVIAGIGDRKAGKGLRSGLVARGGIARLKAIGVATKLRSEGETHCLAEASMNIEVGRPLAGRKRAVEEVFRRRSRVV